MQTPTKDIRIKKYQTCSPVIKDLYASEDLGTYIGELGVKYGNINHTDFINIVGDIILGFYEISDLPILLQTQNEVSADDAQRIVSDLSEFLAPVIAREKGEVNQNKEELKELQNTFTPAVPPVATKIKNEIKPAQPLNPEERTHVQAMRTMEGDMSRVHGYGAYRAQFPDEAKESEHTEETIRSASQADLLAEKPKLTQMPVYEEGEEG